MASVNNIVIVGRLGQDPEVRFTDGGKAVCNLSVATDRLTKGEKVTDWHRVTVWDKQAEACGQYLAKGRMVAIVGTMQYRKYADKSGVERTSAEILASNVQFLPDGKSDAPKQKQENHDYGPPPMDSDVPF
jgi:single-strand DNA-binding protein